MDSNFLKVAKEAALEAGKAIQKYAGTLQNKNIKHEDPSDYATDADIEAEKVIVKILIGSFPDHNILAEEQTNINKKSEYTWVIDPIDGTIAFGQNIPNYTVSIGLLKNNVPVIGVINHVSFKNLYWAEIGKGAFLNGKRIKVSSKKNLDDSAADLELGHRQRRQSRMDSYINKLITKIGYIFHFGSAVLSQALVADGTLDFYVSEAYVWDFAAGAVIVREAGGKVTDFSGNEPDWTKERLNIVASNGLIHDQIINLL